MRWWPRRVRAVATSWGPGAADRAAAGDRPAGGAGAGGGASGRDAGLPVWAGDDRAVPADVRRRSSTGRGGDAGGLPASGAVAAVERTGRVLGEVFGCPISNGTLERMVAAARTRWRRSSRRSSRR